MSPLFTPARMYLAPVCTGGMRSRAGVIATITTITTGTGTTGFGRGVVRS